MEPVFELYECPKLRARITAKQCSLNRECTASANAQRRLHKARHDTFGRRECVGCPGVLWFAKQSGQAPIKLSQKALKTAHEQTEQVRRRTSFTLPERSFLPLRREDLASLLGRSV